MTRRFQVLDGLRGGAALIVALHHTPFNSPVYNLPLIVNAPLFVDFFFVLSGFVLTHAHVNKRETLTSFFLKRTGRLWPLHIVMLLAFVGLECIKLLLAGHSVPSDEPAFVETHSLGSIFTSILLLQALGVHTHSSWNGPAWSISTEMWVSMLFIVLVLAFRKRLGTPALLIAGACVLLLSVVSPEMAKEEYKWAFFRCCYGFFTGVALYSLVPHPSPGKSRCAEWPLLMGAVLFVWFHQNGCTSLLAPLLFAVFIYVFSGEGGGISRWLKSPVAQWLGERSYSIYMTNYFVSVLFWRVAKIIGKSTGHNFTEHITGSVEKINFGGPVLMTLGMVLYLLVVVLLSACTYTYVEVPWRRRFNRTAEKERQRTALPATESALSHPGAKKCPS